MRRDIILMIWIGGAVLAALIYGIGADRFLDACLNLFDTIDLAFRHLAFVLGAQAFGVVQASAIAFYLVFAVLAFMASQRGLGGIGGLIVMTFIVLLLVWRPYSDSAPISHWLVAMVLVLVGAMTMTQRLIAPPRRPVPPPYPPGRAP